MSMSETEKHAKAFERHVGTSHHAESDRERDNIKQRALWKLEEYHALAQGRAPTYGVYGHFSPLDARRLIESHKKDLREDKENVMALNKANLATLTAAVEALLKDVDLKKYKDFLAGQ